MTPADALARIKEILGPKGWLEGESDLAGRLVDWRGRIRGTTPLLARPASTAETAGVVAVCHEAGLAITPQGGNTGLVGGATPQGELLMSLERMRAVRAVDPANDSLIVEAGLPLSLVHEAAAAAGRIFPLSLGSQGAATIGGLVSTNAGGVAVLRYGMMRDLVFGLEAVMPDGRVWDGLRTLRKDNTGYDLKQLLIGAEGTLGVVTAAALKLFAPPARKLTSYCGLGSVEGAVALLGHFKRVMGDQLTAFELLPAKALALTIAHIPGVRAPLSASTPWLALVECSFAEAATAGSRFEQALEAAAERGLILDAALAQNEAQSAQFWRIREELPEAERRAGPSLKHDISVPISAIARLIGEASEAAARALPGADILAFGHVGDGNVHFNVAGPPGMAKEALLAQQDAVAGAIYDVVERLNGSISAEHGVGVVRKAELARRRSGVELEAMAAVKRALDPKAIMNPRVLFER